MQDHIKQLVNTGAYETPFSGTGVEFEPLGVHPHIDGFTVHETGYNPDNSNWNYPSIFSPFWRLIYNSERAHCVIFKDDYYELTPDHIMLIPDHQIFHALGQRPVPTFWIHFTYNRMPVESQKIPIMITPAEEELSLIKSAGNYIMAHERIRSERLMSLSLALLHIVLSRPEIQWKQNPPEHIIQLTRFIEKNIKEKLPNELLAKKAGVSIAGLFRIFQKHLGTSPSNFVNQLRIRSASQLLSTPGLNIDTISEQTGFPNRAYFSRVFKQITGMSPSAYRRAHK